MPKVGKVDAVVGADVLCEGGILPLTAHSGPQASQHTTRSAASTGGAHPSFLPQLWKSTSIQAIIIIRSIGTYLTNKYWKKLISGKQCCGSGMFIPDPDFCPSRIPDLGSKNSNKRERWKNTVFLHFFAATNITKSNIILFLNWWRKFFCPIYKEL